MERVFHRLGPGRPLDSDGPSNTTAAFLAVVVDQNVHPLPFVRMIQQQATTSQCNKCFLTWVHNLVSTQLPNSVTQLGPHRQESSFGMVVLGCPRFPNLLPVCLLIRPVFDLTGRLDRFENVIMPTMALTLCVTPFYNHFTLSKKLALP